MILCMYRFSCAYEGLNVLVKRLVRASEVDKIVLV